MKVFEAFFGCGVCRVSLKWNRLKSLSWSLAQPFFFTRTHLSNKTARTVFAKKKMQSSLQICGPTGCFLVNILCYNVFLVLLLSLRLLRRHVAKYKGLSEIFHFIVYLSKFTYSSNTSEMRCAQISFCRGCHLKLK